MSKQKKSGNTQHFSRITSTLMTIYVLFYLCVFPLATHDKYFDILDFRFKLYWIPTLIYGIVFLVLGILYLIADKRENGGALTAKLKENLKWSVLKTKLTKTDICFIALILIMSLSVLFADYQYEALWGSRGRFNGLVLWFMFFIAYWLVTRFYHFKKWHLYAYLIAACLPEIWGITDFFLLDLLHFHVGGAAEYIYTFVSSVGNINTYTNMVALHFGASVTLFVLSECKWEKLLTFVAVAISSFAIVMGISDNGLLAAGAIFAFLPFVAWTSRQNVARFFVTFSLFATSVLVTAYLTTQHATIAVADGGSVLVTIGKTRAFMLLTAALWLFTMVIAVLFRRKKSAEQEAKTTRVARRIWLVLFIVAVVAVIAVLVDANSGRHPEIWEAYKNVLIFSDTWGTGRGINWRFAWEFFTEKSSFLDKLIGNGPDTYYIITMDNFKHLMKDAGYGIFDSAHNEYLECLVTIGVLGTIAYIGMLATSLRQMLKNRKNVYAVACGFAILAYAVQAVVNIAIPITTPIFMILLYVGINNSQSSNFEKGTL
ncbi:MAG: O-antigen ligase family protein [Oribacterium sp.]|nr:O-antigen ligase family protein [Oribacterium sp.]